ncbi:two-component sensor histidine kinase [Dissulfurispira thermophila]|uniref:histidine kinase n=1 Tax=Dissulfurispira thermophila TaxID=2715679 RepID=A0A7G1H1M1_9BACT|nr:ATP-binding protein [Dissulfurispira thermophila]BCB96001.1 two-component sensor histidine kinase [Dissulfurispira thermophila]
MMNIFKSVRFRLLILSLLAVFVITSVIVMSDVIDTNERLIEAQKEKAVLLSDTIKQSIMLLMLENRWKKLQTLIEDLSKSNPELKEVRIFHPISGRIIISNKIEDVGERIYEKDWNRFVKQEEFPFIIKKYGSMFATRVLSIKNMPPCHKCHSPEQKTLGVLDVEISLAVAQESIKASTYKHVTGLVVGFVIISLIFLIGGERLINAPLRELTDVMKRVESGDLSVRVKENKKDEFGYLSRAFNHMIDALESAKKEIERCHMEQMERASKLASLGEIISGIAHEIKNPLAGISCAIQVFNAELSDNDSKKSVILEILNQVNRLDRIVKDLLSYAKPKPPMLVPSKLHEILDKALFFVYPEAKGRNIVIDNRIDSEIPEILVDPDQIQQVFLNMIINAVHAMPNGGMLIISASKKDRQELQDVIKRQLQDEKFIAIEFQDTGKGISPEDLPYIFEPFFTKKTKGTGLGLSISRKIIMEHGGGISVKSELGKGSIFTVYLPMKD